MEFKLIYKDGAASKPVKIKSSAPPKKVAEAVLSGKELAELRIMYGVRIPDFVIKQMSKIWEVEISDISSDGEPYNRKYCRV